MKKRLKVFYRHTLVFVSYSCLVIYAFIFNNPSGWFMFYFVTLVFLLSLLALVPRFKKLQLKNKNAIFYNKDICSDLELTFLKRWSVPGLGVRMEISPNSYEYFYNDDRVQIVSTNKEETIIFKWTPMNRGVYNHLSFTVITSDFFKLFSKITTLKLETPIYILPKENPGKIDKLYSDILKMSHLSDHQRTPEIKKYRTYQDGDSWRLIDWNLSARNRELIIKEFEVEQEKKFHLIFLGEASRKFETMLSCYYSFQKRLTTQMDVEQTLIGKEGSFSYSNSQKIFAWLSPFKEMPQDLNELDVMKEKIVLVFLTLERQKIPAPIKKIEKRNTVCYISLSNQELVFRYSK